MKKGDLDPPEVFSPRMAGSFPKGTYRLRTDDIVKDVMTLMNDVSAWYEAQDDNDPTHPDQTRVEGKDEFLAQLKRLRTKAAALNAHLGDPNKNRLMSDLRGLSRETLLLAESKFGRLGAITLKVMDFQARLLNSSYEPDWTLALQTTLESLVRRKREALGRESEEVRYAMDWLTSTRRDIVGSPGEALLWVVSWRETHFGSGDIDTLHARGELADHLMEVGKYAEAERLLGQNALSYGELDSAEARKSEILSTVGVAQACLRQASSSGPPGVADGLKREAMRCCYAVLRDVRHTREMELGFILHVLDRIEEVATLFGEYQRAEEICRLGSRRAALSSGTWCGGCGCSGRATRARGPGWNCWTGRSARWHRFVRNFPARSARASSLAVAFDGRPGSGGMLGNSRVRPRWLTIPMSMCLDCWIPKF